MQGAGREPACGGGGLLLRFGRAVLAVFGLALLSLIVLGAAVDAVAGPFEPRGERVDIGGRELRIVCAGPASAEPLVVMEAGAFGLAADFGALQESLAAKGVRSCAYDRAGMGWSDPAPSGPRDALRIAADLDALLAARGEDGPLVLMGHSMAGIHLRALAARIPNKVAGLVLIEAVDPQPQPSEFERRFVPIFEGVSNVGAVAASIGVTKLFVRGDRIGLPPQAAEEKRRAYGMGRHMRTSAREVSQWRAGAAQAAALAPFRPEWPVAVILAGEREGRNELRAAPARRSAAGYFEAVPEASHTSILGEHSAAVVRGLDHVLSSLSAERP
jgi:pimeloyl-ACP methyl ester carboxylesterase